eukprot:4356752-Pyramimonas_sp.AAC.1
MGKVWNDEDLIITGLASKKDISNAVMDATLIKMIESRCLGKHRALELLQEVEDEWTIAKPV